MRWNLEWGRYAEQLGKLAEKGKAIPALENQPEIYDDLFDVWQAFQDLNNSRTAGFDVNPIQISQIEAWLRLHRITDYEEQQDYFYLIRKLDDEWLRLIRDKRSKKPENKKHGNAKAGNRR